MRLNKSIIASVLFTALVACTGCSSSDPPSVQPKANPANPLSAESISSTDEQTASCQATGRLQQLWDTRRSQGDSYDYPIGPGDVIRVSMADLPELHQVDARVDGTGDVGLPLLGEVHLAGLTEEGAQQLLTEKVREFQREPRVQVFIEHYSSRNVEVMGMVARPGTYALSGPGETILSVMGRAGGSKGVGDERAAERVVLFPVEMNPHNAKTQSPNASASPDSDRVSADAQREGVPSSIDQTGALKQVSTTSSDNPSPVSPGASVIPIIIDLSNPSLSGCLNLPARPGDIILVPAAGQVGVYGWVSHPGSFDVTAGMTVLGAVTAAGGAMFSSNAELLRTEKGSRVTIPLNLSDVESGKASDLPVQGGDVVVIRSSVVGAAPYAVYTLFSKFGAGMYLAPAMAF